LNGRDLASAVAAQLTKTDKTNSDTTQRVTASLPAAVALS